MHATFVVNAAVLMRSRGSTAREPFPALSVIITEHEVGQATITLFVNLRNGRPEIKL